MKIKLGIRFIILILLFTLTGSCGGSSPETPPPTDTIQKPTETVSEIEPEITDTDTAQSNLNQPLINDGPWWVFSTADGLFAINADGSGLTQFYQGSINPPYSRQILAAHNGGHIAFLTVDNFSNTTLRLIRFPGATIVSEQPLTSAESEPGADAMPGDPEVEAVRAMTEVPSIAFSPNGNYLAFMGAIDGPTSDLYVLSLDTIEITRLTSGPSQGYQPVWSPDGKFIVHTGVRTFGTGAGYDMAGVWAAQSDDSGVITLYEPLSNGEEIIGWVDDRTFVVHSWDPSCGSNNLRTVNIETKASQILWPDYFQTIAWDPSNAVAVLSTWDDYCLPESGPGLYIVPSDGRAFLKFVEDQAHLVRWSQEANLFLALSEFGVLAIDSNGQFINLDRPLGADPIPAVAPGSKTLAWTGDSLWIGPLLGSIDNPPREIFPELVYTVTWDPSGQMVIFFADSGLYVAQKPDYIPMLIAEGLDNRNGFSGWVMP